MKAPGSTGPTVALIASPRCVLLSGLYSLQMKQVLWKLRPLHWISSAWYAVFSQAEHLAPPPQFGILGTGGTGSENHTRWFEWDDAA